MSGAGLQTAFVLTLCGIFLLWMTVALYVVLARLAAARLPRPAAGRKWRQVAALQSLDATGLPRLERALTDEDEDVIGAAVTTLGSIGTEPAAELLVRALKDGRYERSQVAAQLDALPIEIDHLLVALCREFDPGVRRWAATLLGRYGYKPGLVLELVALSGDPEPEVRAAVVRALAGFDQPAAVATALELLSDEIWYVRANAARTLAAVDGAEFGSNISELLADERWWVRTAAKEALQEMGAAATPAVIRALEHEDAFARDSAAEVLQTSGALDRLVARAAQDPEAARLAALVRQTLRAA